MESKNFLIKIFKSKFVIVGFAWLVFLPIYLSLFFIMLPILTLEFFMSIFGIGEKAILSFNNYMDSIIDKVLKKLTL
jgi:hypothetical protein